jgi:hypothetical protein
MRKMPRPVKSFNGSIAAIRKLPRGAIRAENPAPDSRIGGRM